MTSNILTFLNADDLSEFYIENQDSIREHTLTAMGLHVETNPTPINLDLFKLKILNNPKLILFSLLEEDWVSCLDYMELYYTEIEDYEKLITINQIKNKLKL